MQRVIEEARELVQSVQSGTVMDRALIGAIQKIEHSCVAAWGSAAALGRNLGSRPAVEAFKQALSEGKRFDREMTELAESESNPRAGQEEQTRH